MSKIRLLKLSEAVLSKKVLKIIGIVLFIAWCGFILWMTLFGRTYRSQRIIRLDLFYEFREFIAGSDEGQYFITLFLENVLLFIPFGFLIPWNKNWWTTSIIGCVFSVLIEFTQYVTMLGEFELDDIIANSIGTIIGFLLFKFIKSLKG